MFLYSARAETHKIERKRKTSFPCPMKKPGFLKTEFSDEDTVKDGIR